MAATVNLLPSGPKNLAILFPGVNWSMMDQYYLELYAENGPGYVQVLTTGIFKAGCCCVSDKVRLHFLNYLGTWDAINFSPPKIVHESKSDEFRKGLPLVLSKTDTGIERFNVRANEIYEASTGCYPESAMGWAMEMVDSPKAFIEWTGTQGQSDSFIPVKIEDAKVEKRKDEDRYSYELVITFKLANEKIILR